MDVENTIQFLLEQQARFDARQAQFEERLAVIQSILQDVATAQERTNEILAEVAEQHMELERSHASLRRDTELSLRALSEAQSATEQRLNSLIAAVERHISSHN
jgi:chromosome segregation ATPase